MIKIEHGIGAIKEKLAHGDLSDMPDSGGSNTDHDARYQSIIFDDDNDTKVQVEATADDDTITLTSAGTTMASLLASGTTLLLHCDGADTSTTFTDATGTHTMVAAGTAQIDTDQAEPWGTSNGVMLLDGNSDYVTSVDHSDFNLGSSDFTVDLRIRMPALPGAGVNYNIIGQWESSGNQKSWVLQLNNTGGTYKLRFLYTTDGSTATVGESDAITVAVDTWYHIAFARSTTTGYYFLDGVAKGTDTLGTDTFHNSTGKFAIGAVDVDSSPAGYYNGYIDEVRLSNTARWTSGFTPATAPYSVGTNTLYQDIVINKFSTAGFVKNGSDGLLSGGNTIAVSDITDIATTYLKLDASNDPLTDNLSFSIGKGITDLDADTKIQLEESTDEDIIRFDTAGTERMQIGASGQIGVGTDAVTTALLKVGNNSVDVPSAIGNNYSFGFFGGTLNQSSTSSSGARGLYSFISHTAATDTLAFLYGISGYASLSNNDTTLVRGIDFSTEINDSAPTNVDTIYSNGFFDASGETIGSVDGIDLNLTNASGTTITTYRGLHIHTTLQSGTITNFYGIYQADANATNYFAGDLQIDDNALRFQEGSDTLSITVPTLTADRAVIFGDLALTFDQSVANGASPTFTGTNITAVASITAADESADTTCFPLFATAATGAIAPKTGTNLTFNSNTGLLTATTISGANVTTGEDPGHTHTGSSVSGFLVDDANDVTTGGLEMDYCHISATAAHTITDSSDDFVFTNPNSNKAFKFNINDGGAQYDFVTIDASTTQFHITNDAQRGLNNSILLIDGTWDLAIVIAALDFAPTITTKGFIGAYIRPAMGDASEAFCLRFAPTFSGSAAENATLLEYQPGAHTVGQNVTYDRYTESFTASFINDAGVKTYNPITLGTSYLISDSNGTSANITDTQIKLQGGAVMIGGASSAVITQTGIHFDGFGAINLITGNAPVLKALYADGGLFEFDFNYDTTPTADKQGALTFGDAQAAAIGYDGTDFIIDSQLVGTGDVLFPNDDQALALGAGSGGDARIYYDGSNLYIDSDAVGSGATRIGTSTNSVEIEPDGDVNFVADGGLQFGEISYGGAGFNTALAAQDTDYQITGFDTNGESNAGVTPDHTNDRITVGKAGRYLISYNISCRSAASNDYEFKVKYNNGATDLANSHSHRSTANAGALGFLGQTCIADIPASATLEIWVRRTDGGAVSKTITIEHITFNCVQIGGTT